MNAAEIKRLLGGDVPPECSGCGYTLDFINFNRDALGYDLYVPSCPACDENLGHFPFGDE